MIATKNRVWRLINTRGNKAENGTFEVAVTVSPITGATVRPPRLAGARVEEGGRALAEIPGPGIAPEDGADLVAEDLRFGYAPTGTTS